MATEKTKEQLWGFAGSAIMILYAIGLMAVILAVISALKLDFVGAGACLVAAALAHGLLLHGLVRR